MPDLKLYGLIGSLIAALGLVAALFFYRGSAIKAEDQLKTANATISEQNATITRMDAANRANQAIMLNLTNQVQAIQKKQADETSAINQLKITDEETRNYLANSIPLALRSVLNRNGTGKAGR